MALKEKSTGSSTKKGTTEPLETNKALAVTGAANLPAFMQDDARDGKENISQQDMIIPRVALMQAVNEQVIEGLADNGHFWHTILEEDLGAALDDLVIIHHAKRYTLWNPRHAGGGVLARASDGARWDSDFTGKIAPYKDRPKYTVDVAVKKGELVGKDTGLGRWGTLDPDNEDSPPMATLTHVLTCALLSRMDMGPFVILLQRSAEPVARMLLSKIQLDPAPIYGQVFAVSSRAQNSDSGDFNQYVFTKNGHVPDQETYAFMKEQHEAFKAIGGAKIDEASVQAEVDPTERGGEGGGDAGDDGGKY